MKVFFAIDKLLGLVYVRFGMGIRAATKFKHCRGRVATTAHGAKDSQAWSIDSDMNTVVKLLMQVVDRFLILSARDDLLNDDLVWGEGVFFLRVDNNKRKKERKRERIKR